MYLASHKMLILNITVKCSVTILIATTAVLWLGLGTHSGWLRLEKDWGLGLMQKVSITMSLEWQISVLGHRFYMLTCFIEKHFSGCKNFMQLSQTVLVLNRIFLFFYLFFHYHEWKTLTRLIWIEKNLLNNFKLAYSKVFCGLFVTFLCAQELISKCSVNYSAL